MSTLCTEAHRWDWYWNHIHWRQSCRHMHVELMGLGFFAGDLSFN